MIQPTSIHWLLSIGALAATFGACSSTSVNPATDGGAGHTHTGGTGGSAATGGAAGSPATGGAGGSVSTGGLGGSAGAGATGGSVATGGAAGTEAGVPCVPPGSLVAEYDAQKISGVNEGGVVLSWPDSSGHAFDLSSENSQPTYHSAVLNNQAVIRFNGTSDHFLTHIPVSCFGSDPSITIFAVARSSISDSFAHAIVQYGEPAQNYSGLLLAFGDFGLGPGVDFSAYLGVVNQSFLADHAHLTNAQTTDAVLWTGLRGPASITLRKNRTLAAKTSPTTHVLSVTDDRFAVGRQGLISDYWAGDIAEISIYAGVLGDAARDDIEQALSTRFGLTTQ